MTFNLSAFNAEEDAVRVSLFGTPAEQVEQRDARMTTVCPVCQSKPGQLCTQPTDTTRKPVNWMHTDRGYHDLIGNR